MDDALKSVSPARLSSEAAPRGQCQLNAQRPTTGSWASQKLQTRESGAGDLPPGLASNHTLITEAPPPAFVGFRRLLEESFSVFTYVRTYLDTTHGDSAGTHQTSRVSERQHAADRARGKQCAPAPPSIRSNSPDDSCWQSAPPERGHSTSSVGWVDLGTFLASFHGPS